MKPSLHRRVARALCAGLMALASAMPASAAEVIRWVVPTPPGAAPDVMSRILAEHMGHSLGQTVLVENKPGASGVIAMEAVLNLEPAATVLFVAGLDHIVYGPVALGRKPWDPLLDLALVGLVNADRWVIVGHPQSAGDFKAMTETARQRPLRCANGGLGTTAHAVCAWFAMRVGVAVEHIPYSQPFTPDLIGGRVDIAAMPVPGAAAALQSGRVAGVALLSPVRHPAFPAIPTTAQLGHPELVFEAGLAMYTRPGGAPGSADRLHAALQSAQADAAVKRRFAELGVDAVPVSRAEAQRLLKERIALNDAMRLEAFGKAR